MQVGLGVFQVVVDFLAQTGVYGFLFPWIIIFILVYAMLVKIKVLGTKGSIIGLLALVVAFIVPVISVFGMSIGTIFISLFGFMGLIMAVLFVFMLILAMVGIKTG